MSDLPGARVTIKILLIPLTGNFVWLPPAYAINTSPVASALAHFMNPQRPSGSLGPYQHTSEGWQQALMLLRVQLLILRKLNNSRTAYNHKSSQQKEQ